MFVFFIVIILIILLLLVSLNIFYCYNKEKFNLSNDIRSKNQLDIIGGGKQLDILVNVLKSELIHNIIPYIDNSLMLSNSTNPISLRLLLTQISDNNRILSDILINNEKMYECIKKIYSCLENIKYKSIKQLNNKIILDNSILSEELIDYDIAQLQINLSMILAIILNYIFNSSKFNIIVHNPNFNNFEDILELYKNIGIPIPIFSSIEDLRKSEQLNNYYLRELYKIKNILSIDRTVVMHIEEYVDFYNIIASDFDKVFIEDMENDPCITRSISSCNTIPFCKKYRSISEGREFCYSSSRFKQYNLLDEKKYSMKSRETNKIYEFVDSGMALYNADTQIRLIYMLIISKSTTFRYITFKIGIPINIDELDNNAIWILKMNQLIDMILEDSLTYEHKYIFCGHSMGCSLMLYISYILYKNHNTFFNTRCIFIGSGQTCFFKKALIIDDFFNSTNIYIFCSGILKNNNDPIQPPLSSSNIYVDYYIFKENNLDIDSKEHNISDFDFISKKYINFINFYLLIGVMPLDITSLMATCVNSIIHDTSQILFYQAKTLKMDNLHSWEYYKRLFNMYIGR